MVKYDGINSDAFLLLGENRLHNSKAFYEEHKEEIKRNVLLPMHQIAEIFGNELIKLDEKMNVKPSRMISRIRRDTRFTRDKSLYRENVWIMFMRHKHEYPFYPCMWFEIQPGVYSYGDGHFESSPNFMEFFRKSITQKPEEFSAAVRSAEKAGAKLSEIRYKREKKANIPEDLKKYYNTKKFYLIKYSNKIENLEDERIINELKKAYREFSPLYSFLKSVSDEYTTQNRTDTRKYSNEL
ncbi:MAG: DUF2461 domain-containing protein [Clostridiales bacterium]|nr:DUF2461 domain-containing protein [Clostridiales bacterium]